MGAIKMYALQGMAVQFCLGLAVLLTTKACKKRMTCFRYGSEKILKEEFFRIWNIFTPAEQRRLQARIIQCLCKRKINPDVPLEEWQSAGIYRTIEESLDWDLRFQDPFRAVMRFLSKKDITNKYLVTREELTYCLDALGEQSQMALSKMLHTILVGAYAEVEIVPTAEGRKLRLNYIVSVII